MNAPAHSSMLDGLTFREDETDERRRCVVCRQMREDGENLPFGECCCNDCGAVLVACVRCEGIYPRREFVTPAGIAETCVDCDWRRDLEEMTQGVGP